MEKPPSIIPLPTDIRSTNKFGVHRTFNTWVPGTSLREDSAFTMVSTVPYLRAYRLVFDSIVKGWYSGLVVIRSRATWSLPTRPRTQSEAKSSLDETERDPNANKNEAVTSVPGCLHSTLVRTVNSSAITNLRRLGFCRLRSDTSHPQQTGAVANSATTRRNSVSAAAEGPRIKGR